MNNFLVYSRKSHYIFQPQKLEQPSFKRQRKRCTFRAHNTFKKHQQPNIFEEAVGSSFLCACLAQLATLNGPHRIIINRSEICQNIEIGIKGGNKKRRNTLKKVCSQTMAMKGEKKIC